MRKEKSRYQLAREKAGLTRRQASDLMIFIPENRLEKIESQKTQIQPAEVVAMQKAYRDALLVNHYCTMQCAIGKKTVPVLRKRSAESILLEAIARYKQLEQRMDSLTDQAADPVFPQGCLSDLKETAEVLETMGRLGQELKLFLLEKEREK